MSEKSNVTDFDLVRVSKSKEAVDIHPNTLRDYERAGLRIYGSGRQRFFSKKELADFIRHRNWGETKIKSTRKPRRMEVGTT